MRVLQGNWNIAGAMVLGEKEKAAILPFGDLVSTDGIYGVKLKEGIEHLSQLGSSWWDLLWTTFLSLGRKSG